MEGYTLNLNKEKFRIRDIIADNIRSSEANFETSNVVVKFNEVDNLEIFADKSGIGRVISNLINNSIKFLPSIGGLITITVKLKQSDLGDKSRRMVQRSITDNGSGIDSEILPNLFTKFET